MGLPNPDQELELFLESDASEGVARESAPVSSGPVSGVSRLLDPGSRMTEAWVDEAIQHLQPRLSSIPPASFERAPSSSKQYNQLEILKAQLDSELALKSTMQGVLDKRNTLRDLLVSSGFDSMLVDVSMDYRLDVQITAKWERDMQKVDERIRSIEQKIDELKVSHPSYFPPAQKNGV